jgi:hypothetical protein
MTRWSRSGAHRRADRRRLVQEAGPDVFGLPCCRQADSLGRGGGEPNHVAHVAGRTIIRLGGHARKPPKGRGTSTLQQRLAELN